MSRRRIFGRLALCAAALLLVGAVLVFFTLRSPWFFRLVRARIVSTVEDATGGRVEIAAFSFDWTHLRAQVDGFTLHGTEPAADPPLFHAGSVALGIKIVSILKRDVDIRYLEVNSPRIRLIIGADGRTNLPEPKVRAKNPGSPVETLLKLAIGRFALQNGIFEIVSRGQTPFEAHGSNLKAAFRYDAKGPRYPVDLSVQPLDLHMGSYTPLPLGVTLAATLERNRIGLQSLAISTGRSRVDLSGALENFAAPRASLRYSASIFVAEATRVLRIPELQQGAVQVSGTLAWNGAQAFSLSGKVHGSGLDYSDSTIRLRGFQAVGSLAAGPRGVDLNGLQLSGKYVTDLSDAQVDARIAGVSLRGPVLTLRDVTLSTFGGSFQGEARVLNLDNYSISGEIAGFEARPVVAMYSAPHLLWDARVSGAVNVAGSFKRAVELRASAELSLTPALEGARVHGQLNPAYEAAGRTLSLGHSSLSLPSSHAEFSGAIRPGPGGQLRVRLETRDLDDLLPALGSTAASLPAKLTGTAFFDGTVTGNLDSPQIAGHVRVTGAEYAGENFDTFEADAEISSDTFHVRNATAARGPLRARFQLQLGIHGWEAHDETTFTASATASNAALADIAQLLDIPELPLTSTVAGSAQITGTVGEPVVAADFTLTRGKVRDEPFDRFTGHLAYTSASIEITGGQLEAGAKRASLTAAYHHPAGHYRNGRIHFDITTNPMPLAQISILLAEYPTVRGTLQATGSGDIDVSPDARDNATYHLASINADLTAHSLQITDLAFGDAHLSISSEGSVARASFESNIAKSEIRGAGEWRLEGDYPGGATIDFSQVDLARLRNWIEPPTAAQPDSFSGSAQGHLRIDGPLLQLRNLKAQLTIPEFHLGPAPSSGLPADAASLQNSGPIVITLAGDSVNIESARLTGRSTALTVTGKLQLRDKNALDLRVNGTIDLALLHDLNPDFESSGVLTSNATVRGSLDAPQIIGRMEFQNAAFGIVGVPNGISAATGAIAFTKDRANIQSFTGQTGGGQISLTGFAGYGAGPMIFRLHARAQQVRVRYPEGVSTVADADLDFTGSSDRSTLSGSVTIVRTAFNPNSDFSSLLAKSAEPIQTASARTGLLGGLNFDVQINTAPDIQFQSSLTQDVQMEANLRLRGTFGNPAILGRININQGQVAFFGTRYSLTQGTVSFYNPVRIDPILDIDLEAKAHGIDVTLNISGPFDKPNLTTRSDPPLQFNEIVALLATGRTPTSDPTMLAQQSTAPQSWQQMGASALLGQAIASPVAGRLQRFFGVSQLRIDPTLPGVENNPQARLTLEQQVTPEITFTYITNVTQSNPQVIRVEWAFAKQWSVVALREENGLFGLDFFFKKRF
ncbi:MAG: translocation/assembly module TamB domain-containing protein [Bryobacteraceae bacterium]